jgi:hypothetical protein
MYRVRRFGVIQTANMAAMLYFVMTVVFLVPFALIGGMLGDLGDFGFGGIVLFFLPPLYAAFGWIATALACWFYNIIAGFVGGFEVELELQD